MGFLNNKITGDGTTQTAITNDATLEAVVNSLVAYNTTGGTLSFTVSINGSTIFSESVNANGTFRLPDKINLGAVSTLEVNAPIGLDVTVSYLQQSIDVAGALSTVQLLAQQASDDADRAENALPAGTIDDTSTAADRAWSSEKIAEVIGTKLNSTNPSITGSITEEVSVCTLDLDPANGTVQTYTATSNPTFIDSLTEGQFITLVYTNGGFTATFPTLTWWNGEPTLGTTDKIFFEKIDGVLYATQVGTIV